MLRRNFLSLTGVAVAAAAQAPTHYPDASVEVKDPRFAKYRVNSAAIERLHTGTRWAEGPVWFGDGRYLLWSDIPNNRILRWTEETGAVSVFRSPSNYCNGNTRDRQGRLITCEHDSRRVTRTEHDGTITVLLDRFQGKRLNAPNDAVVDAQGGIWFTDPGYGIMSDYEGHKAEFELPTNVYRIDPNSREATVVVGDIRKPNGLCFSPDEKKLYIADTGGGPGEPHNIRVYDVAGGRLSNGRNFVNLAPGYADGIRCDADGNVWAATGWGGPDTDGVQVIAPDGVVIGKIHLPEICANLCFGGVKRNRLFMAASQSMYSLYVGAQGAQTP